MKNELENLAVGVRSEADESEFRIQSKDPQIVPDYVSAPIEGYFRIPAIWVGDAPDPDKVKVLNRSIHHEKVFRTDLKCGIKVAVQRDGLFWFDFSQWPLAPMVIVPGYRKPDSVPYTSPPETQREATKIADYSVIRAQVMNAHQVFFTTAEALVKGRFSAMGFPVTTWNSLEVLHFNDSPSYHDQTEDIRGIAHNVLNNSYGITRNRNLGRRTIEIEVVAYSFKLLDELLIKDPELIAIIEAGYTAACRMVEHRYGEALTVAWGACEQLITHEWRKLLEGHSQKKPSNMTKERQKKLGGRDYTASVMIEMLEVSGRIDHELYKQLEISRKARNYWMHEMRVPKGSEAGICIQALQAMLLRSRGIKIVLQTGFRGLGGANTPYWIWALKQK